MEETIIYRNLQWSVTPEGHLVCNDRNYEIDRSTLESIDWIEHMKEKDWCNDFYFRTAYEYSLKNTLI